MTSLIQINTTDVSGNIVRGSYKVSKNPVYKEYKDANGVSHRRFIREKMSGNCKMFFKYMSDYEAFATLIENNRSATNYSVPVTLYDNKSGDLITVNAFLDYEPTIKMDAGFREYIDVFDLKIEER